MQRYNFIVLWALLVVAGLSMAVGAAPDNVALGKSYTVTPVPAESYADPDGVKLTDGLYRFAWDDMVGWADTIENPTIIVDLGAATDDITNVTARLMRSAGSGVNMPLGLTISGSVDGINFTRIGETKAMHWDPPANENINAIYFETNDGFTARYVQIEVEQLGAGWVMVAEVEILTGRQPDYFEVASGTVYELSVSPHENYADPDGTKLTDGDDAFALDAMVGWETPAENPVITLDLGLFAENIDMIGAKFMRSDKLGVVLPEKLIISISSDGSRWFDVDEITGTGAESGADEQISLLSWQAPGKALREVGQYVRLEIVPGDGSLTLLNELTVGVHRAKQDGGN